MAISDLPEGDLTAAASVPAEGVNEAKPRRVSVTKLAALLHGLVQPETSPEPAGLHVGVSDGFAETRAGSVSGQDVVVMLHPMASAVSAPPAPSDTTPPTLGGSITIGTVTSSSIQFSWPAGSDNVAVTSYEVSSNGGSSYTDVGNVLTYTFTGLAASTSYALRVRAKDAAGNVSAPLSATQSTGAASSPPTTATMGGGSSATAGVAATITITLDAPADQTYTVTPVVTGADAVSTPAVIPAGGTSTSFTVRKDATGSMSVDFTISPTLTRAGRPLSVTVGSYNTRPYWNADAPTTLGPFTSATPYSVPLAGYATDADGDPIIWSRTGGTAPAGVVVNASTGVLTIPNNVPVGTHTVTIDITDIATTPVVAFGLTGGGADKAWTFGQVFKQGDAPAYVDAVATAGTLTAFQAEVRNRWSDGSIKFAVVSGIGATAVQLRSTGATPATGTVPLGSLAASVTISSVVDYLGASVLAGPVTVTMPTSATAAVFGASPASHSAGLVRSIPGPVMTEYHYYAPVPGEPHLAVWWYVRAYVNGAREVETQIECSPWVTVSGGGRRDYTVSVSVGGTQRLAPTAVVQYARTAWSRVDWLGTAPQVKPQHDTAYLRKFAFPYNNLATPNPDALNYGSGTAALLANTFGEAMAPPINNPASQLQWPNEIGATGTGGMLRTNIEAAYAAGADVYWSAEAHARAAGRFPIHVRDPITGRPWDVAANPTVRYGASFTGGYWNQFAGTGISAGWKTTHAPPIGSGAYLLSGRYSFMERMQQQANAQALDLYLLPDSSRYGYAFGGPYPDTSITPSVRYGAWLQWGYINQTAWTPATLGGEAPSTADSALRTSLATYIERFMIDMRDAFVTGTIEGGKYQNALGCVSWSPEYLGTYNAYTSAFGDNFQQNYICFVLDAALDLDLPISVTAKTAHTQLHAFAMSRVVSLTGTWSGSGWNYRYYSQHLPYGPDDGDGVPRFPPATWYTTYSQLWTKTLEVRGFGTINESALSDANGGNLTNYGVAEGYFQVASWARSDINLTDNTLQQFSVLALAVDRGITGAAAAWARLQSSPTMTHATTLANFKDYPATCFTPRTL